MREDPTVKGTILYIRCFALAVTSLQIWAGFQLAQAFASSFADFPGDAAGPPTTSGPTFQLERPLLGSGGGVASDTPETTVVEGEDVAPLWLSL